jgi:outer membrane protein, heavy metal efflux system
LDDDHPQSVLAVKWLASVWLAIEMKKFSRYLTIVVGLLLFIALSGAHSGSALLTERESIERVLRQDAVQAWIDGSLDEAYSEIMAASRWDNPTFSYVLETSGRRDQNPTEQFYVVSQDIDLSGRRSLRRKAAQQRFQSVEAGTQERLAELTAETRRRFFEVLFWQQRLEVIRQWTQRLAESERIIRLREAAGDVSGYDLRRLVREYASAQAREQAERAHLHRSWERLQSLWTPEKARLREEGVSGVLLPSEPVPVKQLLEALERNPALRALAGRKITSELNARAADRWTVPKFNLGLGAKTFHAPAYSDAGVVVTLSVPLPLWHRNQAERMRYRAQAQILDSDYLLAYRKATGEVRALWKEVTGLIQAARTFELRGQSVSDELIHIAVKAYEGGEIGVLELIDAYREQLAYEAELLELAKSAREASIELDRLSAGLGL